MAEIQTYLLNHTLKKSMGTYLEEYLDSIFLLPSELKRNFELVRELDEVGDSNGLYWNTQEDK